MRKFLLIFIIFLASILRLYNLAENRPHLTNDEVALGYNAYSILTTGKDEWGEAMPVIFKSFGDWKPGFYVYLTVPSVAVFGLNDFAVRLPSALSGVFAVILIFLIAKKLFKQKNIAYFASLLLAISPWHIHFSRGAWEANVALTLLLAGIYFFLISLKNNKYLIMSAIFFGLTLWTYQSAKLGTFIVLLALAIYAKKDLLRFNKKYFAVAFVVGLLIALPVIKSLTTEKAGRIEVKSLFSYERPIEYIQSSITDQSGEEKGDLLFSVFHPEWFNFTRGVFSRYSNHFSGRFLFFEGDWPNPKHSSPNIGYFLLLDAPLLIIGLLSLSRGRKKEGYFVLLWLALAPLASAITRDSVHGVRALNMVIPLVLVSARGASVMIKKYKFIFIMFVALYLYNFAIYLDAYHVHGKQVDAKQYFYGYKQVVEHILPIQDNYEKIIFDQSFDQPYIFFNLYGVKTRKQIYQPKHFQANRDYEDSPSGDVGKVKSLGNIVFRDVNWEADKLEEEVLLVGREEHFPLEEIYVSEDYNATKILYPDGKVSFVVVEVNRND